MGLEKSWQLRIDWQNLRQYRQLVRLLEAVTEKKYTSKTVMKVVHHGGDSLSYAMLKDWQKRLSLLRRPEGGESKWRRFSIFDILVFYLLFRLKRQGVDLAKLNQLSTSKYFHIEEFVTGLLEVLWGREVLIYTDFTFVQKFASEHPKVKKLTISPVRGQGINVYVVMSLNEVLEDFATNLSLNDFQVEVETGNYFFTINTVPMGEIEHPDRYPLLTKLKIFK